MSKSFKKFGKESRIDKGIKKPLVRQNVKLLLKNGNYEELEEDDVSKEETLTKEGFDGEATF